MKGIVHFVSGVTVASFCPWAIEAAQNGNPLFFIIGAVAGLLPDTIDFKVYRYFYKYDVIVVPDAVQLDPQPVADAVAGAITRVATSGKPVRIKVCTIPMGANAWRQYRVEIDPAAGAVRVQFGPVVSTGQVSQPDTVPARRTMGVATFSGSVVPLYDPVYTIDIFDGPGFRFYRNATGRVEVDFLPWHRTGSHSLVVAVVLAALVSFWSWQAGIVLFAALSVHILEDQLGYMGSSLLFPLSKKRQPGLRWMHSGDAFPNFAAVWMGGLLIFWNLYAASPAPTHHVGFFQLFVFGGIFPFAGCAAVRLVLGHVFSR